MVCVFNSGSWESSLEFAVTKLFNFLQGFIDEQYSQLQMLQDESNPEFVEEVVTLFFTDSERLLENLTDCLYELRILLRNSSLLKSSLECSKQRPEKWNIINPGHDDDTPGPTVVIELRKSGFCCHFICVVVMNFNMGFN